MPSDPQRGDIPVDEKQGRGEGASLSVAGAAAAVGTSPVAYMPPVATQPELTERVMRRSLIGQALHDTFGQTGARLGAIWIAVLAVLAVLAPFIASSHPMLIRLKGGGMTSPMLSTLGPLDVALVVVFSFTLWVMIRLPAAGRAVALLSWPILAFVTAWVAVQYGRELATLHVYRPSWLAGTSGASRGLGWAWVILLNVLLAAAALVGLWLVWITTRSFIRTNRDNRFDLALAIVAAAMLLLVMLAVRAPENTIYEHYRELERAGKVDFALRTIIPYSPNDRLRDQPDAALKPPSRQHWFGTTLYGEDMLSRMIHACRVALAIGVIATGISTVIGIVLGGLMGYYAGAVDLLGMRVLEIVEAIPTLILLLIVTVFFGRSLYLMMVVIGLVSWPAEARFIRAEFLKLRNLDFVQAGVALGLPRASIIFRHMLPNGVAPVLVHASFGIAGAILLESVLSFLGLGLGPEDPSWGQLLNQARSGGRGFSWWIATYPGAAIFLTVFAYVLIGEALRDAIDPKLRKRD
jgi:peptide/nickel transport system permease protein